MIGEGRAAHIVVDRLALIGKARGVVGHQPFSLRGADGRAQVGLARQARLTLPAFGRVKRDDVITGLQRRDARSDLDDDAGTFVAEDRREQALGIKPVERIGIGVANARGLYLDQDLAETRTFKVDLDDFQRLFGFERDGGTGFHGTTP